MALEAHILGYLLILTKLHIVEKLPDGVIRFSSYVVSVISHPTKITHLYQNLTKFLSIHNLAILTAYYLLRLMSSSVTPKITWTLKLYLQEGKNFTA